MYVLLRVYFLKHIEFGAGSMKQLETTEVILAIRSTTGICVLLHDPTCRLPHTVGSSEYRCKLVMLEIGLKDE
jgi:hypothetical protein